LSTTIWLTMHPSHRPTIQRSDAAVIRSDGALLAHALGNVNSVLFFDLEALERTHFDEAKFKDAFDSMQQELSKLRSLITRAAILLNRPELDSVKLPDEAVPTATAAPAAATTAAPAARGPASRSIYFGDSTPASAPTSRATSKIAVLCVDDNPDIVAGLELIIDIEADMYCDSSFGSADELLAYFATGGMHNPSGGPIVVLLDANMKGKSPLGAVRDLTTPAAKSIPSPSPSPGPSPGAAPNAPNIHVLIYSGYEDQPNIDRARDAGASGYIAKSADPRAVLAAIRTIARGETLFPYGPTTNKNPVSPR